ncbi:LOW QUALITY PROTEIN: interleukin-21 receptor [Ornithorhynchus anatinus]|nr:LOW QUALITY PROTEIN: interleukin-21 receptor [Ornithorhynchus anatinus]
MPGLGNISLKECRQSKAGIKGDLLRTSMQHWLTFWTLPFFLLLHCRWFSSNRCQGSAQFTSHPMKLTLNLELPAVTCYVDYAQTVTCIRENSPIENDSWNDLMIKWNDTDGEMEDEVSSCQLNQSTQNLTHTEYTCFLDFSLFLGDYSFYVINSAGVRTCRSFTISENIKPYPPFNLTVTYEDGYNISWKSFYEDPRYHLLNNELHYELRYKKTQDPWKSQKRKSVSEDTKTVLLLPSEFQRGTEYEVQVRAQPKPDTFYSGVWSEWSDSLIFRTQPGEEKTKGGIFLLRFIIPGLVLFPIFVYWTRLPQRLWKKMWVLVPDPAPFFKPLYMAHKGDFKSWVGMPGTLASLDFLDWGVVVPEVSDEFSSCLPQGTMKVMELKETKLGSCPYPVGFHDSGSSRGKDRSYGLVSIDTVLVTDEVEPCGLHCGCSQGRRDQQPHGEDGDGDDGYPRMNLDDPGDGEDDEKDEEAAGELLLGSPKAEDKVISSGQVSMDTGEGPEAPAPQPPGDEPGWEGKQWEHSRNSLACKRRTTGSWKPHLPSRLRRREHSFSEGPYDFFSSRSREDCHPLICLDMDTIDSGFAGSDCGSPVECEFDGGSQPETDGSSTPVTSCMENEPPRCYVKQWVTFPGPAKQDTQ